MEAATDRPPLMLIHGAWLSSRSWENFADYFRSKGFAVSAPEWPRKHGDVEELKEHAEELKGLGITEIVDHYEKQIRALDEPPVLIGHSFGGLIVELLLDRGLGRAGVAMSPAPPKGILVLPFSSLKAASPALAHPSKWHGVVPLTLGGRGPTAPSAWRDGASSVHDQRGSLPVGRSRLPDVMLSGNAPVSALAGGASMKTQSTNTAATTHHAAVGRAIAARSSPP